MAFVHLRVQSSHSAFSGAITPAGLAKGCKARGMAAAALTDTGTTAAVVQWKKAAEKSGIRPIFGAIVWLKPENRALVEGIVVGMPRLVEEPGSLLLLAETVEGWENLSVLCSLGSRDVWLQPRVSLEQVGLYAAGLHAIVPFDHGRLDAKMAERLDSIFPSRWGAEVFDHGEGWEGSRRGSRKPLAAQSPYGEVGTNAVRYLDPTDVVALHALRCTGLGATLDSVGDWVPQSDQAYLCDEAEMRDRLGDAPVDAAGSLAERLTFVPTMKGYHFPKSEPASDASPAERWAWLQDWFPLPGDLRGEPVPYPLGVDTAAGELEAWFAVVARRGLEGRLAKDPSLDRDLYVARLETEIKLICEMKFPAYMLIVAEFIVWAKDRRVPVGPGRGSVAGSLVAWAMRITEVDSLRFTLLFERFLNPARVSMPDVDVDFGQALRESVIEHMRDRYGREHVGQISNFGTFKPKSAIKDMLRGLGVMFKDANRITGASDDDKASSVTTVVEETDSLRKLYHLDPVFRRAVKLSVMLVRAGEKPTDKPDALLRQRGVHAAGVVVAPRPLSVYAPVFHDAESGRDVLSVDMDGTEVLGLIKFDFLGLKTLDVIEEALDHVERLTGTRPDMDAVPLDDPEVFEVLASGDVQGLFQVESDGMKGYLQQLQPDHVEDVIAMLALYRPGPLGSGMVEDFIERKRGRQEVVHLHPLLEPILRATYGVLVYQESILQAAQVLAGFSLGHADLLRRAIGKKKPEEIAAQKKGFVDGCLATNGIPVEESTRIFGLIEKFAEYGFNRCASGDTILLRAGGNIHGGPEISLRDLATAAKSNTPWGVKIRAGRLHLLQMCEDGRVRPGRLIRVIEQGVQVVYDVKTKSGKSIKCTLKHRLLTTNGYKRVEELEAGNELIVMGEKEGQSRTIERMYREINKGGRKKKLAPNGYDTNWTDGRIHYLKMAKWDVRRQSNGVCESCGTIVGDGVHAGEMAHQQSLEVLGMDLRRYHSAENIKFLCNSCHKRLDYAKGERVIRWGKGTPTLADPIVSITEVGPEETWDLEMEAPNHNFIASGIVSHNSHSAAYGLITYRTAWLKAHHRIPFLAACASWEGNAHEALSKVLHDASRVGIGILPPDVHRSGPRFTIEAEGEKMALRYGLGAIKGLGAAGLVSIQSALEERPFSDMGDFAIRTELDSGSIKALVEAGALDGIVSRRDFAMPHLSEWRDAVEDQEKAHAKLCKSLTRAHEKEKKSAEKDAAKGAKKQVGMFAPPSVTPTELALPSTPPPPSFSSVSPAVPQEKRWTWLGRLAKEQKAIGVVLSGSPMLRWGDLAEGLQTHRISEMASAPPRIPIALCAVVRAVHEHRTKTGTSIGFVLLVDDSGRTEVTLFSNVLHASKAALKVGTGVLVRGTMDRPGPTGILIAGSVEDLDQVRARGTRLIRLGRAGTPLGVDPEALDGVLALHPGTCPVRVNGQTDVAWKPILESRQVTAGGALFDDLERTFGMPGAARSIV